MSENDNSCCCCCCCDNAENDNSHCAALQKLRQSHGKECRKRKALKRLSSVMVGSRIYNQQQVANSTSGHALPGEYFDV